MLHVTWDLFKVSLYLFRGAPLSRWPVDNSPYSMTFGRRLSNTVLYKNILLRHFYKTGGII